MLGEEELPGYFGPHPGPFCSGQGSSRRQAGRRLDRSDAFGDLDAEWADVPINDLERRPEPGRVLVVGFGEVRPLELLLTQLGQRVQAAAEQCSHLLGSHRVAGVHAIDPVQPGTNPRPRGFPPLVVVGRQSCVPFLGRIQGFGTHTIANEMPAPGDARVPSTAWTRLPSASLA